MLALIITLGCAEPAEVNDADTGPVAITDTSGDSGADTSGDSGADTGSAADCSGGTGLSAGDHFIEQDGVPVWVRVPDDLPACAPLLLWGHGGQSPGDFFEDWSDPTGTGLHQLASSAGFVFVAPGVVEGPQQSHGWSYGDDVWIEPLIDTLMAGVDLDRHRVWWVGNSAGGFLGLWLGLNAPDHFTAMGIISSGGVGSYFDYPSPEPSRKLPFYLAHDPEDQVTDYSLSVDAAALLSEAGHTVEFTDWTMTLQGHGWADGLSEALLQWMTDNGLPPS